MAQNFIIHKSDSAHVRHQKKRLRNKFKRSAKYKLITPFSNLIGKRREHFSYIGEIEYFCEKNHILRWEKPKRKISLKGECSLHNNPNEVLRPLLDILHFAKCGDQNIDPIIVRNSSVSFGAMYLIDNICWEIASHRKWRVGFENFSDADRDIMSNLRTFRSYSSDSVSSYIINEKVEINRDETDIGRQQYKVKAKDVTDMVELAIRECKEIPDYILPFHASSAINSTIGEHFDNIKQHAPNARSGVLCGFYNKAQKEVDILIFNFGHTIAETLSTNTLPDKMKFQIDQVITNHTRQKVFSSNSFTRENALTLLAIQEGISSKISADESRGHGLIDYIENCFSLNKGTRIVIISGKTAIKIDNKYQIGTKNVFDRKRRIIAFNEENDIYTVPSTSNVMSLGYYFPGVIIETTIPLS